MATPERDAEATQWTRPSSSLSSQERGSSPLVAVGVTRPSPPPESVSPRLNAAVAREACVYLDKWRYASARLSPMQRRAVEEDPRLARLFLALDLLGPKGAPRGALAAQLALVSTTTLWRLFRAVLGCTYFKFVRRWRVAAAALIYRCGKGHLRQDVAAERTGFWTRSRLRAAFLACTGLLPTGRAPRSLASASRRRSPLFAGTG
jgi:AraC-like DNA-binding protein